MKRRLALASVAVTAAVTAAAMSGCVSVEVGKEPGGQVLLSLRDAAGAAPVPLGVALAPALLVQALPGHALADTVSIAYSRREGEFAFYQLASWADRPVRAVPRLLQQRLQGRRVAEAVGLLGDPMAADWLLTVGVETLHHDIRSTPGVARVALQLELFDRRARRRLAQARFEAAAPLERADSAAAAAALSVALAQTFDQLMPWVESGLARGVAAAK